MLYSNLTHALLSHPRTPSRWLRGLVVLLTLNKLAHHQAPQCQQGSLRGMRNLLTAGVGVRYSWQLWQHMLLASASRAPLEEAAQKRFPQSSSRTPALDFAVNLSVGCPLKQRSPDRGFMWWHLRSPIALAGIISGIAKSPLPLRHRLARRFLVPHRVFLATSGNLLPLR